MYRLFLWLAVVLQFIGNVVFCRQRSSESLARRPIPRRRPIRHVWRHRWTFVQLDRCGNCTSPGLPSVVKAKELVFRQQVYLRQNFWAELFSSASALLYQKRRGKTFAMRVKRKIWGMVALSITWAMSAGIYTRNADDPISLRRLKLVFATPIKACFF